ncbi:MAG: dTMP kinase [Bdellovibrionota bacterium]
MTFEGTEGVGKSTLIREVAKMLRQIKVRNIITREPGGSRTSEKIRQIILSADGIDPMSELLLYEAARAEHVTKTILPALRNGVTVLCDRFSDSSLAYQAYARGLPWSQVKTLNKIATKGISPNLVVLLDVDPALGLRRAKDHNRFENEGIKFQKRVRMGFLKARAENPRRWLVIKPDARSTPADLAKEVLARIRKINK